MNMEVPFKRPVPKTEKQSNVVPIKSEEAQKEMPLGMTKLITSMQHMGETGHNQIGEYLKNINSRERSTGSHKKMLQVFEEELNINDSAKGESFALFTEKNLHGIDEGTLATLTQAVIDSEAQGEEEMRTAVRELVSAVKDNREKNEEERFKRAA